MKDRSVQWTLVMCVVAAIGGCSTSRPLATQPSLPIDARASESFFTPAGPGATLMSKVAGGYQLTNRVYRVVISDQSGDVIFWGTVGDPRNTVFRRGIYTSLTGLHDAPMRGYIEKRDEQTWQFYGEDDNHITWRKIYCLEGNSLFVSIIIQNNRPEILTTTIQINGDLPSLHIQQHEPEQFTGAGGHGVVSLHGYNEFHFPSSQPALPTLIQSDTVNLKPGERQSYTSQWMLSQ